MHRSHIDMRRAITDAGVALLTSICWIKWTNLTQICDNQQTYKTHTFSNKHTYTHRHTQTNTQHRQYNTQNMTEKNACKPKKTHIHTHTHT